MSVRAAVIGATGYTGAELVGLLAHHPGVDLVGLYGSDKRSGSVAFETEFPRYRGQVSASIEPLDIASLVARDPEVVFLATPHTASAHLVHELGGRIGVVVDLSASFRVPDVQMYRQWYQLEHPDGAALERAVYALVEHARVQLQHADLIAVPGCYPTAALLGLLPIAQASGLASGGFVSVNGISGVSGAGRSAAVPNLFCEVSLRPYGVSGHRHQPEIEHHLRALGESGGPGRGVLFTPHVGPWDRGMVVTTHAKVAPGWDAQRIAQAFARAYPVGENPFVRVLPTGQWPSVAAVEHTNFCDIAWHFDAAHQAVVVTSAIDNLLKGAAGQAVQAFNIRMGFDEATGLPMGHPAHRFGVAHAAGGV